LHTISSPGHPDRRGVLAGFAVLGGCALTPSPAPEARNAGVAANLETYAGFGAKNAGGAGDEASGAWVEARLEAAGLRTERHAVPALELIEHQPHLRVGRQRTAVATHATGVSGAFASIDAPFAVWGAGALEASGAADGAIVAGHLASQRWSSAEQPAIRAIVERAFAARAAALVLITHGPTGELIRLNRRLERGAHDGPVALMAPKDWPAFAATLAQAPMATLELNATEGPRAAFNVVGRLDRGAPTTIVVSTPRSGWTQCAGERGPGIAAFLALAEWAPQVFSRHNLFFVCTSAHEFENAGNAAFIAERAPRPEQTALWLHLGAGFAARDWHEAGGQLAPLPSADPQRYLMTSPQLRDAAHTAFAGVSGLEAAYSTERGAAGELANIIAAGYPAIIGMFGAHRFHHVAQDDMRCVEPAHTAEVVLRLQHLLTLTR
jgi:hypothetical protein